MPCHCHYRFHCHCSSRRSLEPSASTPPPPPDVPSANLPLARTFSQAVSFLANRRSLSLCSAAGLESTPKLPELAGCRSVVLQKWVESRNQKKSPPLRSGTNCCAIGCHFLLPVALLPCQLLLRPRDASASTELATLESPGLLLLDPSRPSPLGAVDARSRHALIGTIAPSALAAHENVPVGLQHSSCC